MRLVVRNMDYVFAFLVRPGDSNGIKRSPIDWCIGRETGSKRLLRAAQISEDARRVTRVQIGHPEGYIETFANLYADFARCVIARMCGQPPAEIDRAFPTVEDGMKGLAFVKAGMESSAMRAWRAVEVPAI